MTVKALAVLQRVVAAYPVVVVVFMDWNWLLVLMAYWLLAGGGSKAINAA